MKQHAAPSGRESPVVQGYNPRDHLPVAEQIKRARADKHISREELAYMTGLALTTIWRAETGHQLSDDVIHKIARILDMDPFDLHAAQQTVPPEMRHRIAKLTGDEMRSLYRDLEGE